MPQKQKQNNFGLFEAKYFIYLEIIYKRKIVIKIDT